VTSDRVRTSEAVRLMAQFAERTGVTTARRPRRYLWTDAFAVCTYLGLARTTRDASLRDTALVLVDQVHRVLGTHRDDDPRVGWISGLPEREGRAHPTRGGLRIGKPLPERALDEPYDPLLEWERDGQYFHYLTRWMHALDQAARATGQPRYALWARELAHAAHGAFTYACHPAQPRRMFWKLSVDLSRPQVPSMGQHDPLEGLVCCAQLEAPELESALTDFAQMIDPPALATDDPLGLGGLLADAYRLAQLGTQRDLIVQSLEATEIGLRRFASEFDPETPAERRLAFRELGLAIGLAALARLPEHLDGVVGEIVDELGAHAAIGEHIIRFWRDRRHREARSYTEHLDINDVMLATALAPEGYIELAERPAVEPQGPYASASAPIAH
jgi:hypothetical protein